ncbi:MAG: formate--tetrahydrofolate ligase, partial [SAR324 cluster bacterium]|nr:formate--tetrahydrofolate ligase [SAR324 cluster bacterium]
MPSDIEISQNAVMKPIAEISQLLGVKSNDLEQYGKYKAKIEDTLWESIKNNPDGKLILVTAITPTPAGEGKTCTSIGLAQAFGQLGVKHALA